MRQKSIVLVTVDCLRADHTGFLGYKRPTTPFLDSLSGESLVFPAAIVAGAPTYYSLPAMMASRYPLALGRDVVGLAPHEATLATALKEAGYATAFFGAANPYVSARFGYERGFDTFRDFLEDAPAPLAQESVSAAAGWASRLNRYLQEMSTKAGPPFKTIYNELYFEYCQRVTPVPDSLDALRRFPAAEVMVEAARQWLASVAERPFFLWLHLMDPHSPYYPKAAALELMGRGAVSPARARYLNSFWNRGAIGPKRRLRYRKDVVDLYDAGIRWVDAQMEHLVAALRVAGKWDDCVFAFTADHGEEFMDHGGTYHPPSRLTEELIRVPLLLRVPGKEKKDVGKAPFSMIHLAPTLLETAQVPVPSSFQGSSYGRGDGPVAITECVAGCTNPFRRENRLGARVFAVREERYKLVLNFDPAKEFLFDLEADPGEIAALANDRQKPVRRRLLEIAREHLRRPVDEQARVRARLREFRLEWNAPATP